MSTDLHPVFHDLVNAFEQYPNRTAIVDKDGRSVSYKEFEQLISSARNELKKRGVSKGSRILVAIPMSIDLYAVMEALFSLGATTIFLDPWMGGKKMSSVIKQVKPVLFITTPKIARLAWLLPATWRIKKWKVDHLPGISEKLEFDPVSDEDNALITFTSGTSGKPKGANRTYAFLHAQATVLKPHLITDQDKGSVDFTNFPIVGLAGFAVGNTVVVPNLNLMKIHEAEPSTILKQLCDFEVSRLIVSPSLLKRIVIGAKEEGLEMEKIATGGAPIPSSLIKDCLKLFPSSELEAIYGSTEAEPICTTHFQDVLKHLEHPEKGVFVGPKVEDISIKVLAFKNGPINTDEFESLKLPVGKVGEIVVKGEHVNQRYFENEAAFRKHKIIAPDGSVWHRTGDMGYLDGTNYYLVGRDHRIYEKDGSKFYPYPLEQTIEETFGLEDIGYVQHQEKFILVAGSVASVDETAIRKKIQHLGYPLDEIKVLPTPLPRDARHRSKLQIEQLDL